MTIKANKNKDLDAIIWRESIFKKDYVCNCGKVLMDDKDEIAEDMLFDTKTNELICPKCLLTVARITTYDDAIKSGAMRGDA